MRSLWNATLAVALPALLTVACGEQPRPPANPPATAARPATTMAPAATTAPAGTAAVAAGDFGVAECDDYMRKYMACIDAHVPAEMKATLRTSFDQQRAAWQQAASTPQGRDGLKMACTQAHTAARQSMSAYGCTF